MSDDKIMFTMTFTLPFRRLKDLLQHVRNFDDPNDEVHVDMVGEGAENIAGEKLEQIFRELKPPLKFIQHFKRT